MGASSSTGVGMGDSHGKHKCANQCGGCGCKCQPETPADTPHKRGCVTRVASGQKKAYNAGKGTTGIRVC
jgi:hypothetical protein